jgi:hypothetical protein
MPVDMRYGKKPWLRTLSKPKKLNYNHHLKLKPMDNDNIIDAGTTYQGGQLTVSPMASGYLNETGKWAKFLAIVGFCMIGLLVIGAIFAGSMFSAMGADMPVPGFFITFMYLLLALFYFFPIYYLFKFAKHIRLAIVSKSTSDLESALENLKSHYKFIGILMIVILSIYVLFGGGAMLAAAFFG